MNERSSRSSAKTDRYGVGSGDDDSRRSDLPRQPSCASSRLTVDNKPLSLPSWSTTATTSTTTSSSCKPTTRTSRAGIRTSSNSVTADATTPIAEHDHGEDIENGIVNPSSVSSRSGSPTTTSTRLGFDGKFHQQQLQQEQQEQKQLQHINLKNAIHTHPHVVFDAEAESLREEEDYFSLREDIYSLIVMSKNCGASFIFGIYVYIVKMTLFSVLAASVKPVGNPALWTDDVLIRIARFVLIPVAVAMQEDLIHVYHQIANVRYDDSIETVIPTARKWKWLLSCFLRCTDGLFSLAINFLVLMTTDQALSIFLNFAALGFLQSIDDVAFTLADQGFFGDRMQKNCEIVRRAKFPKLDGSLLVASLDSILYALTCLALFGVYAFVLIEADNHFAE